MPGAGDGNAKNVARLNLAHSRWLVSVASSLGLPGGHAALPVPPVDLLDDGGSFSRLSHELLALTELFASARAAIPRPATAEADDAATDGTLAVAAIERERCVRATALIPLSLGLKLSRQALDDCAAQLERSHLQGLRDAMQNLDIEYARLSDAERLLFDRKVRQALTGEVDDDPEFTAALERVVYATNQGDDVASAVSQSVRTMLTVLRRCVPHC